MRLGTNGIVINELGKILLIQRNDTRTYAPPGGGVEAGELPTDNVAREIREETGIIALPVRLVSLNYWPIKPGGHLAFTFRCIQRGGELQTSPESPQVGFFATNPLPSPMLSVSKKRVEQALTHGGGPISWWATKDSLGLRLGRILVTQGLYRWYDLRRKMKGADPYIPPADWQMDVRVLLKNEAGQTFWLGPETGLHLPGGNTLSGQAPWDTAVAYTRDQTGLQPQLTDLSGVYIQAGSDRMTLVFTGQVSEHQTPSAGQWFAAEALNDQKMASEHQFFQDAQTPGTNFVTLD